MRADTVLEGLPRAVGHSHRVGLYITVPSRIFLLLEFLHLR